MDASKGFMLACAALFIGLVYGGYKTFVSIPDEHVRRAENLQSAVERQETRITQAKAHFKSIQESDEWRFLEPYSHQESWSQRLESASASLDSAKTTYDNSITPIIERDHKEDVGELLQRLADVEKQVAASARDSGYPAERIRVITEARKNKELYFTESKALSAEAKKQVNAFTQMAEEKSSAYSAKEANIEAKAGGAQDFLAEVQAAVQTIDDEYRSEQTDFALFADTFIELQTHTQQLSEYIKNNTELLGQLDRTYVKILQDQKVDYFVVIGRANWCEGEYCGEGNQMRYPPASVDDDTFEYFDTLNMNVIARMSGGWGRPSFKLSIPQARWDALGISPTYSWDRSKEYAEYWVENTLEKAYHQYAIIEDGEVTQTEWVPVRSDYFWSNHANLGMAIETKPKGHYESELQTTAEPVGMAMIAEPTMVDGVPTGSNQYGEWRQSNGTSFWVYYGMYRMLGDFMGPSRYTYNDWDGYRRHGRASPYYGRNNEYGTYGASTYANSRYRNSDFARRNPGALSQASTGVGRPTSLRGAGPAARSQGPSGGGK